MVDHHKFMDSATTLYIIGTLLSICGFLSFIIFRDIKSALFEIYAWKSRTDERLTILETICEKNHDSTTYNNKKSARYNSRLP